MTEDLKQNLPISLQDELEKNLSAGEQVVISLPGAFGEAFALTDKRALVIRELDSRSGYQVFSYANGRINGAEAVSSGTGGYIELRLAEPVSQADMARVYFPSYELSKFTAAAEHIRALSAEQPDQPARPRAVSTETPADGCQACGEPILAGDTFCSKCGRQVMIICSICSARSPAGSDYCTRCGSKMVEFDPNCPRCGGRIQWAASFCSDCGSIVDHRCAACGSMFARDWKYCVSCGRELGSDKVDAGTARSMRARLDGIRDSMQGRASTESSDDETDSPDTDATAEELNARGRELFDSDHVDEAIHAFERAASLDPSNPSYHCNLAVAYDEADRDEEALEEYERTLELDPNDLTALLSLGYMYSERDDFERARSTWSKILAIAPDSAEAQEVRNNIKHQEQL